MLELIEDSLSRMLDDAAPDTGVGASAGAAIDDEAAHGHAAAPSARALIESLDEAGMLDVLAPDESGDTPLAWADAARLFMLLGAKAPDAPVADAILARALLRGAAPASTGAVDALPAFTVLASQAAGMSLGQASGSASVSGTLDGIPRGDEADAAVAVIGDAKIVVLARPEATAIRASGTGVEPRAAWTFDDARPLAVLDCAPALRPALLATAARAAQIAGAMRAARELTVRYANDRVQFGKPIGRQQAVQHRIAVMAEQSAMVGAAAMLAWAGDGPPDSVERVQVAKGLASDYAAEVAAAAHAVHGAIGFTDEYALARLTRRLWQWRSEYGGAAACYEAIGDRVLAGSGAGIWQRVIETTSLRREA